MLFIFHLLVWVYTLTINTHYNHMGTVLSIGLSAWQSVNVGDCKYKDVQASWMSYSSLVFNMKIDSATQSDFDLTFHYLDLMCTPHNTLKDQFFSLFSGKNSLIYQIHCMKWYQKSISSNDLYSKISMPFFQTTSLLWRSRCRSVTIIISL